MASIANVELPRNEWPDLLQRLMAGMSANTEATKIAVLNTLGYICETIVCLLSEIYMLDNSLLINFNCIAIGCVERPRKRNLVGHYDWCTKERIEVCIA